MYISFYFRVLQRSLISSSVAAKHTLPDLPYDFGALEPYISADIMKLHHQKHHATYVNNLNIAEEKLAEAQAKGLIIFLLLFFLSTHLSFTFIQDFFFKF